MNRILILIFGVLIAMSTEASIDEGIRAYNKGDYTFSFIEFSAAAKRGEPVGKHLLASLYYQGHGVGRDLTKAVQLFREAADANYLPSIANLALMYSSGDGVPKDIKKGLEYGLKAAKAGDIQSQFNLGQAYRKGIDIQQDYSKAIYWYKLAAENGSLSAQNEYGLLFAQGLGMPIDYIQAFAWIDMPASEGNSQSIKNRDQLLQILSPMQQQDARELALEYAKKYSNKQHL